MQKIGALSGIFLVFTILTAARPGYSQTGYTFTIVSPPGATSAGISGINSAGTVAGSFTDVSGTGHAFVETADGTFTAFDAPGAGEGEAFGTGATCINDRGEVAGYFRTQQNTFGSFIREPGGAITTFDVHGASTYVTGIDAAGDVVGTYPEYLGPQSHSFLRTADGTVTLIDPPGAVYVQAYGINAAGAVVGDYSKHNFQYSRGFIRWPDGSFTTFEVPGAQSTVGVSINSSGVVTGSYFNGTIDDGFVRDLNGNIATFVAPGGTEGTYPMSINDSGVISGFVSGTSEQIAGFLRSAQGSLHSFEVPNSREGGNNGTYAIGMNNSSSVVGFFDQTDLTTSGFILVPR